MGPLLNKVYASFYYKTISGSVSEGQVLSPFQYIKRIKILEPGTYLKPYSCNTNVVQVLISWRNSILTYSYHASALLD